MTQLKSLGLVLMIITWDLPRMRYSDFNLDFRPVSQVKYSDLNVESDVSL